MSAWMPIAAVVGASLALSACHECDCPQPGPGSQFQITSVEPPAGSRAGGSVVQVHGSGFLAATGPLLVLVGNAVATVNVIDDGLLEVTLPASAIDGAVTVRVVGAGGFAELIAGFVYDPLPPVASFSPGVGSFIAGLGGTVVEVEVASFPPLAAPTVTFGGVPATGVTVVSPTLVRVRFPDGLTPGSLVAVVVTEGSVSATATGFRVQGLIAAGDLVINEFLVNPGPGNDVDHDGTPSTTADEFLEIVNRLAVSVDLTYFEIHDATGFRHRFPNPTTVPAGGSIVVFAAGNPSFFPPRHASGHAQVASTGDLALTNTGDDVSLRDPTGAILFLLSYSAADVTEGKSRTLAPDGRAVVTPASGSIDYVLHDAAPGAVGNYSPGAKVDGSGF